MLHIVHVTPYYPPAYAFGGVTRSVSGMAEALARRGLRVTVVTTDAHDHHQRSSAPSAEQVNGVRVLRVPNASVRLRAQLNLSTPFGLGRVLQEAAADADLLHLHEFRTVENLLALPSIRRRPTVLSPHGTLNLTTGRPLFKRTWDALLSPRLVPHLRQVIALAAAEAAEAQALWTQRGWGSIATQVIPNGVHLADFAALPNPAAFRARYGLGDAPICLFMGRLHPRKGVKVLVEAFHAAQLPTARLVIVGGDEGAQAELTPLLNERITLTGFLSGAERLAAFAAADCFALPAVGEGLPMVALEALACGLPVILSPGCNLPEVATAGAGLVVEPHVAPLAAALRQLLTAPPTYRQQLRAAAQALVAQRFTWDAVAEQLHAVYQQP